MTEIGKTAFKCVGCGGDVYARNPLAYKLLMAGKPGRCAQCRSNGHVRHWDKERYQEYLQSACWKSRRRRALKKAGHACQICKSTDGLEVHHNTYDRLGRELDSDLLVTCREHHRMIHT